MRISIEIDDQLIAQAKKAAGKRSTKTVVEMALEYLARTKPMKIMKLRGKVEFEPGWDYKSMR
jgi:Arc/MetJ family transcription regulator